MCEKIDFKAPKKQNLYKSCYIHSKNVEYSEYIDIIISKIPIKQKYTFSMELF